MEGNHFGGDVFLRNGYDTIAIKVSSDDWFQSISVNLFDTINGIIFERGYKNIVAYGSSMGGYAAIALSKLLSCCTVIVFSPQYSIDEDFDTRWSQHAKKIDFQYRISTNSIKSDCKYFIFYDNKSLDVVHVRKITEIIPVNNIYLIKLPYTGHPSIHYLAEVGLIKDLGVGIAKTGTVEGINFLEKKRMSKSYLFFLSYNLFNQNHNKWALSTIQRAIEIDDKNAGFFILKSDVLVSLGRLAEALIAMSDAVALDPNSPRHQHHHVSHLLIKRKALVGRVSFSR